MVKTVMAVFACFLVDYVRESGNPFHSAIAAIISMQRSFEDSLQAGRQRIIATIIGGLFGLTVVMLEVYVYTVPHQLLRYLVLSLLLIPLMKITISLKQAKGVSLTCVVFFAITISNPAETGALAALTYAINRILDTLIGVVLALGINALPLDFWRRKREDRS